MLILLVENKQSELKKLQKYVTWYYSECNIIPFTNSVDAMKFIESDQFSVDLCFIEIDLPVINGFSLVGELRKQNKKVKVVFLASSPEYAVEAWKNSANDYLITPVTANCIEHTLTSCF